MKSRTYLLLFFLSILVTIFHACSQTNDPNKYIGTALDAHVGASPIDTTEFNAEYLQYSTVKISGILPLESKYERFLEVFGKPDSVINNPEYDCQIYPEPYHYMYFKGSMFYLVNDTVRFQRIDFRNQPNLELKTPAITLNGETTLQDMQRLFPKAMSKIRSIEDPSARHLRFVDLGASAPVTDEWWILSFDGNKLVMVELYSHC
jgi:hypothetical protein